MKGDIGLGESYIAGYWDCKDISKLIKLGVANYSELERVIKGSILKIFFFRIRHILNRNSKKGARKIFLLIMILGMIFLNCGWILR